MLPLIGRRLLWAVPLLFVVSMFSFVLLSLVPGDAATAILGPSASAAQYQLLRRQLGLDHSLITQYLNWLGHLFHGSLGHSVMNGQSVTSILNGRLGVSLSVIIASMLVSAVAGISLGAFSAVRGGFAGRVVDAFAMLGLAIPSFWFAVVLIRLFAVDLGWLPATGWVSFSASPSQWFESLVLPVVTISFTCLALLVVQTRDSMLDVLSRDYIRVLRANGYSERSILFRHALRNAAIPVVTILGLLFVGMLTATVLIENVFALPGLGNEAVQAAMNHDVPVLQGEILYFTILVIAANLVCDIAHGLLDPRVRVS